MKEFLIERDKQRDLYFEGKCLAEKIVCNTVDIFEALAVYETVEGKLVFEEHIETSTGHESQNGYICDDSEVLANLLEYLSRYNYGQPFYKPYKEIMIEAGFSDSTRKVIE